MDRIYDFLVLYGVAFLIILLSIIKARPFRKYALRHVLILLGLTCGLFFTWQKIEKDELLELSKRRHNGILWPKKSVKSQFSTGELKRVILRRVGEIYGYRFAPMTAFEFRRDGTLRCIQLRRDHQLGNRSYPSDSLISIEKERVDLIEQCPD